MVVVPSVLDRSLHPCPAQLALPRPRILPRACSDTPLQEVWGPPVPPAAYPRGYTNSPGYNYSNGYKISNAKRQRHGRH
jgi:hypothetical protein